MSLNFFCKEWIKFELIYDKMILFFFILCKYLIFFWEKFILDVFNLVIGLCNGIVIKKLMKYDI